MQESNLRPTRYEWVALPTVPIQQYINFFKWKIYTYYSQNILLIFKYLFYVIFIWDLVLASELLSRLSLRRESKDQYFF